jgi:5'-methylthioadenosine phosphorylase
MRIGIIGGTGVGQALIESIEPTVFDEVDIDTPFGKTSAPIRVGHIKDVDVAILPRHGRGHLLNPAAVPYRANLFAMKKLQVTHIVATGAAGSLREEIRPGDLVICDQLIDKTDGRPRTFYENAAVHVEMAEPFCPVLREWLNGAASDMETPVHNGGTYLCMEGPGFSTVAESEMHRGWGADLVGMTSCPEARLAREAEIAYAALVLVTDYDCWRQREIDRTGSELLQEIMDNMESATTAAISLVRRALADVGTLEQRRSPAHDALKLAIWSDKSRISDYEVSRLHPLWGRHFPSRSQ